MEESTAELVGAGWRFPMELTPTGGIALSTGDAKLAEAIRLIVATAIGERPMRPAFGCGVHDLVFDGASQATTAAAEAAVRDALLRCEPRVVVQDVRVDPDRAEDGLLWIDIDYQPLGTTSPRNLVVPFYSIPPDGPG